MYTNLVCAFKTKDLTLSSDDNILDENKTIICVLYIRILDYNKAAVFMFVVALVFATANIYYKSESCMESIL